jgi:hypothetical protein
VPPPVDTEGVASFIVESFVPRGQQAEAHRRCAALRQQLDGVGMRACIESCDYVDADELFLIRLQAPSIDDVRTFLGLAAITADRINSTTRVGASSPLGGGEDDRKEA